MNKKIIASVLAIVFAFSMVGPVSADTSLQDQINALLATIAQLQAQIAGQTATPATTAVCFDADLQQGMTSDSVKDLQIKLGVTPTSGYFGPITLAAVKTFQTSNGIINTGYVGPLTRGALNALYCTPVTPVVPVTTYPEGCTSAVGFSTTTGLSCAGTVTYPAGCTSAVGYSPTTGLSCAGVVTYPAGCTSAVGFSSTTGLSCAGTTTVGLSEGSISVLAAPIAPVSIVYGGDIGEIVYAFNVKASYSDVTLKKVDVYIKSAASHFPWRAYTNLYLYDGNTQLGVVPVNEGSLLQETFGQLYVARFDNISLAISKDVTKTLTVKADVMGNPLDTTTALEFGLQGTQAVRAIDSLGLNQYAAYSGTNTPTINTSNQGSITLTTNVGTPVSSNVLIDATVTTSDIILLDFNIKAKNNNVTINNIVVTPTVTSSFAAVKLYDGSTFLQSKAIAAGETTVTFDNLSLPITKDATKTYTIKVDVIGGKTGEYTVTDIAANGVDAQYNSVTGSLTNAVYKMTGVTAGPIFTLISATTNTIAPTTGVSGTVSGTIVFSVKAEGLEIDPKYTATSTLTDDAINAINMVAVASDGITTSTPDEVLITMTPDQTISDGNTAQVSIVAKTLTSAPTTYKFRIEGIWTEAVQIDYSSTGVLSTFQTGWSL